MEHLETIIPIVRPSQNGRQSGQTDTSESVFITANTISSTLEEIKTSHMIPVFTKDNEPLISQADFVETVEDVATEIYSGQSISRPIIRISHPVKGRIPEAKDKPAQQLMEWEKTLYYERMMFILEVPSIQSDIGGNQLSLTIGGVKSYNQDNLYSRSISDQHFKVFIGFQNKVCTNLCVWTDGYLGDLKVKSIGELKGNIKTLISGYNENFHLSNLKKLIDYNITENQFAHLVGRCRMYNHLPTEIKSEIKPLLFGDQQIGAVVKDFYRDNSFCRDSEGNINLWKLYNLFTGVNKTTYIDSFLDRSVNAYNIVEQIRWALDGKNECWYLS